jgi:STE24 endopeptidase
VAAPDAATAAWLARIPSDQRIAAHAFTDWRLTAWIAGGLMLIGACLILSRTGALDRLKDAIESERPRPWLTSAALTGVLTLILVGLRALIDAATDSHADQILGRGSPSLWAHLAQAAPAIMPAVIAGVLFGPPALWLMRRLPRVWPLIVGGALAALIVAAVWLPYALSIGPASAPAPPGPVRDGLVQLIAETGLPAHGVFFSPDPSFDGDVSGAFGRAKVSIGPMLAAGPPSEARAMIGHIMGHYAHSDILVVSVVLGLVMTLGCFAISWWAAPLARLIGSGGVASAGDPEALPAIATILIVTLACAGLAEAGYLRWANVRADSYSLDHAREPDGLASVIEREWDHQSVDPSWLEEALFYTHPAMSARVRHAMAWKVAHGG